MKYIFKNTKLEGAISGPDRAPILQDQIWARSGRAFHYWSGARQITLSGPHFSRSGPDRRPTKISARVNVKRSIHFCVIYPLSYENKIKFTANFSVFWFLEHYINYLKFSCVYDVYLHLTDYIYVNAQACVATLSCVHCCLLRLWLPIKVDRVLSIQNWSYP